MSKDNPILVTGAAGNIGSAGRTIVKRLRDKGIPVRALWVISISTPKSLNRWHQLHESISSSLYAKLRTTTDTFFPAKDFPRYPQDRPQVIMARTQYLRTH